MTRPSFNLSLEKERSQTMILVSQSKEKMLKHKSHKSIFTKVVFCKNALVTFVSFTAQRMTFIFFRLINNEIMKIKP